MSPIVQAIRRYRPEFDPPEDNGMTWIRTICPFHNENHPSAAISYELDAFNCLACGVRGNVYSLIRQQEGGSFATAERIAADIQPAGSGGVSQKHPGEQSSGIPAKPRNRSKRRSREIPIWVR